MWFECERGGGRERQSNINDLNLSVGSEPLNHVKVKFCIINKVWVDTAQVWAKPCISVSCLVFFCAPPVEGKAGQLVL